jgi:hypothetical protein
MSEAILGFPNYQATTSGDIISYAGRKARVLKARVGSAGYLSLTLCKDNIKTSRLIHQLIAETFLGPRPKGYVVDHIDRDKLNNKVENLRWVTYSENNRNKDPFESPSRFPKGVAHKAAKLSEESVREIYRRAWALVNQGVLAKAFKVSRTTITQIKHGQVWASVTGHENRRVAYRR